MVKSVRKSSNYFKYVQEALGCNKVYSIRHEELVVDTILYTNVAIRSVLGIAESVDIDKINKKAKNSKFFVSQSRRTISICLHWVK